MVDVIVNQGFLGICYGFFDSLKLLSNLQAASIFFQHDDGGYGRASAV